MGLVIRPLADDCELDDVYRLTYDVYRCAGYCPPAYGMRLLHYSHLDRIPQTVVFGAFAEGGLVGTNTLTRDGPRGLHVDHDFRAEADAVRREGRLLGASWRIVTRPEVRSARQIVLELIRATAHAMIRGGIETLLFTFHPKHERIYQRLLSMTTLARRDAIGALANAPAVLMRVDWEDLPERWLP